ncbi:hypothetical protein Tco_0150233 [Tanacetum coccineum]
MFKDQMLVYTDKLIHKDVKVIKDMKKDMKKDIKISQPKERKPWLQKKDLKKVLIDSTEVNTGRRAFMEELDKLKCSADAMRSVLFVENLEGGGWMEMAISSKACFGGSSWKQNFKKAPAKDPFQTESGCQGSLSKGSG